MAHVAEYRLTTGNPELWCVLIYIHVVGSAILLSGFWSLMAESFDPHSAKQIFGRITAAGTLGGITGGLMAERIAAVFSANGVLLLLAALHLACSGVLGSLQRVGPRSPRTDPRELISPVELFRRAPYLSAIAVVVLAGTSAAAILDYLFKAGAGAAFGKGAPLLRFFAVFYTSTQILTFFAQTFLAPRWLRRIGIRRTISALPLAWEPAPWAPCWPDFPVFTVLRSLEVRPAQLALSRRYELLYTPVRGRKRSQGSDRRRLRPRR
jgi:ATP/ADP translocase